MKSICVALVCVSAAFLSTAANAYSSSAEFENQLNICRQEYKNLVNKTNEELKELKRKAPLNFPEIYKQKQKELKQKADSCKQIKQEAENVKQFEIQIAPIENTQVGHKFGPKFRCLQLGQNWSEFEACSKSLGYAPEIKRNNRKQTSHKFMFATSDESVFASLNENNYIEQIEIRGGKFWRAKEFDENFLRAFMQSYGINELIPDKENDPELMAMLPIIEAFGVLNQVSLDIYKGEFTGGKVKINPGDKFISIKRTPPASSYTF